MRKFMHTFKVFMFLFILGFIVLGVVPAMAYNSETPDQSEYTYVRKYNMEAFWEIDTTGLSSGSTLSVVNMEHQEVDWGQYEVPENGATVMIFFSSSCPTSSRLFLDLARQPWLGDERINVMALSADGYCEAFRDTYAQSYIDKVDWYSNANQVSAFYAYSGDLIVGSTFPIATIITEEECQMEDGGYDLCRVVRFSAASFTDSDIIGNTLKWMFPDLSVTSEVEIPDKEYRNIEVKATHNYDYAHQVLELVNKERYDYMHYYYSDPESLGIKVNLDLDAELTKAAMQRAVELSINYDHKRSDYTEFNTVISEIGYDTNFLSRFSENIAIGYETPAQVMEGWVNSKGHYLNMVRNEAIRMGVGHAEVNGVHYWVQIFEQKYEYYEPLPLNKFSRTGSETLYVPVKACTEYLYITADTEITIRDNNNRNLHIYQVTHFSNADREDMTAPDTLYQIPIKPISYDTKTSSGNATIKWDEKNHCFVVTPKKKGTGTFKVYFSTEKKEAAVITVITKDPYKHTCSFSEWREYVPTNCYTGGVDRRYCLCGKKEFMNTPIAHREHIVAGKEPTCTRTGYTESSYCEVCLKELKPREVIPEAPHDFVLKYAERPATCTSTGNTAKYECSVCKTFDPGKSIPKLPHTEEIIPGGVEATCTKAGYIMGKQCTVCGTKTQNKTTIPALGHDTNGAAVDKKDATCTEEGYTSAKKCSRCGVITPTGDVIPALGHDEEIIPGTPATCQKKGLSDGKKCKRCGLVTVAQTELSKTGHREVTLPGKAANCKEAGVTKGSQCQDCGLIIIPQLPLAINPYVHTWDDGVQTGNEILYTCTGCKQTKTEKLNNDDDGTDPNPDPNPDDGTDPNPDDDTTSDPPKVFKDVSANAWYKQYVDYSVANGIFSGTSENTFSPNKNMTRAQFVQVLANLEKVDTSNGNINSGFTDVPKGKWYTAAVTWAVENGIVNGVGAGKFDPNANVTREQMCVMLVNYAKFKGITLKAVEAKENFTDNSKISSWAKDAVYTCQQADIVNGKGTGVFDPKSTGTRAEACVIFTKFHKEYMK